MIEFEWKKLRHFPTKMYSSSAVIIGRYIYCGGGSTDTSSREQVISKYSIENDSWSDLPSLCRSKFSLVEYQQRLVAIGGMKVGQKTPYYCRDLLCFNDRDCHWEKLGAQMLATRMQSLAISRREYIVVAGGCHMNIILDSIEVFDGKKWHKVRTKLPLPTFCATSALLDGYWYIGGGETTPKPEDSCCVYGIHLDSIISQDAATQEIKWRPLAKMPYKRSCLVAFRKSLFAIGGVATLNSEVVYRYSFTNTKWVDIRKSFPIACYAMVAVNNHDRDVVVIGGYAKKLFTFVYDHVYQGFVSHEDDSYCVLH